MIRFTDNYIEIPESRRSKVEIITRTDEQGPAAVRSELRSGEEAPPPSARVAGDRSGDGAGVLVPEPAAEGAQIRQRPEALIKAKADLDNLHAALTAEKEALEKEQAALKTAESIRAYRDKVNLFNGRLADYERQRQAFQIRAEAYNRAIGE